MIFATKRTLALLFFLLLLAACQSQDAPAKAVEAYFTALIAKDTAALPNLVCAEFESNAQIDLDTFSLNPATLEHIACKSGEVIDGYTAVDCQGKVIFDYNGEIQEINLADLGFRTIEEDGEWRMCGYR